MKKTIASNQFAYVFLNAVLALSSAVAAYGFFISENPAMTWLTPIMFIPLLLPAKDMISKKHQKAVIAVAGIAAAVCAALVISQVGIWVLNIRYSAVVFFAAVSFMAASEIAFFIAERKNIASAA